MTGGFEGQFLDTTEPYTSHECLASGVKCWAAEARFGGIVIQAVPNLHLEGAKVDDFDALIAKLPTDALKSPFRSTVPLLAFFRHPHIGLITLEYCLRVQVPGIPDLDFESPRRPPQGRGKPSYTDLMIRGSSVVIGIEAKSTEPRYQTTEEWLGPDPTPNREHVLQGWLSIIEEKTGSPIPREAVLPLPYQLIHRAASVCAEDADERILVYVLFGADPASYYVEDCISLAQLTGSSDRFSVTVVHVPFDGTARHVALSNRWRSGERDLTSEIAAGLLEDELFVFGYPRVVWSNGRAV